ncbi:BrxE family protein [Nitrosospira sp. Nsp1]|uniref:BrxE family protein n=1 Tax=Nitrosospira sp. Nsp1 TaxID=136547 RepID=UPI00088CFBBC|nr:BrxE family protein [Nitrosospira sp. Nsp1]SCX49945.1 hypothetical protein SAMN05720354_10919 [Nitrosospira sp. Nsp1]
MKESLYLTTLLHIRLLVGFLGERAQFAWWPTAFYESSSRFFLEPVFSKTSRLAQYHGIIEAARRLHDEHLNVGSYHLFRLPEEVEQDLHVMVQSSVGENFIIQVLKNNEIALDSLRRLAEMETPVRMGPFAIGNIKDIGSIDSVKTIASAYLAAFSGGTKTYPYLVA